MSRHAIKVFPVVATSSSNKIRSPDLNFLLTTLIDFRCLFLPRLPPCAFFSTEVCRQRQLYSSDMIIPPTANISQACEATAISPSDIVSLLEEGTNTTLLGSWSSLKTLTAATNRLAKKLTARWKLRLLGPSLTSQTYLETWFAFGFRCP